MQTLDSADIGIHALMVVKGGRVQSEQYWAPYAAHKPHTLFSVSKTLTALAVGFAVQEGYMGMDDRIVSYFPDLLTAKRGPKIDKYNHAIKKRRGLVVCE